MYLTVPFAYLASSRDRMHYICRPCQSEMLWAASHFCTSRSYTLNLYKQQLIIMETTDLSPSLVSPIVKGELPSKPSTSLLIVRPQTSAHESKMSYKEGIIKAISELKDRTGSSMPAIKKHMMTNMGEDKKWMNAVFLKALKNGVKSGMFLQNKNSYKLSLEFKKTLGKKTALKKEVDEAMKVVPKKDGDAKKTVSPKNGSGAKAKAKAAPKKKDAATKKAAPKKKTVPKKKVRI